MQRSLVARIIDCIFLSIGIAVVGLIVMFFSALLGGLTFYTLLTAAITIGSITLVIVYMFTSIKRRLLSRVIIGFIVLGALSVAGREGFQAYEASITMMSDQDVDLREYKPFAEHTKAKRLEPSSKLVLRDDLPRLDGATALYPLYSAFVQAVYPEKNYDLYESEVMANTTPQAYENLINGTVDIIFAAGPSEEQREMAKNKGVELTLTPIGKEAFVFFVNAANPVTGLTTKQIQDIYTGSVTDWSEVGGKPGAIQAFQRPENSGSQTMLLKVMGNKQPMAAPREDIASGMGGIISQTADYKNYKNAIGYSFLYFATEMVQNGNIRLLEVDGVKPDKKTIRDGTYPLTAEFYAVTAGSSNPHVGRFIEWIRSAQGQTLVEQTGYTPMIDSH